MFQGPRGHVKRRQSRRAIQMVDSDTPDPVALRQIDWEPASFYSGLRPELPPRRLAYLCPGR